MTEFDEKQRELQAAIDGFFSCLSRIEARDQERLAHELEQERVLIQEIRAFTAQGLFFRAFSLAEREQLLCQLEDQRLEMGRCAVQLQKLHGMIEERLKKQQRTDARRLTAIQKSFSPEEYAQYADLFRSDLFLSCLGAGK